MRSLEQSKGSILLGKRKVLGKYFQGSWSYLKWNGFPLHLCPLFLNLTTCTKLCRRHRYILKRLFFRHSPVFCNDQCGCPAAKPTDTLVYFSHAHFKFQHFPAAEKACVCLARRTKKVGKYQQVVIYIRTKTNKPSRKELLRRSSAFFAPEILLMWLQATCQPNLIWIYIQRKCLV